MARIPFLRKRRSGRPLRLLKLDSVCVIERVYLEQMVDYSREQLPNEACGIIAGKNGRAVKLFPTINAERSPVRYMVDPAEQLRIMMEMEEQGWELLGIFHSHTHSQAYPSQTDIQMAYFDDALYFIVSLANEVPAVRAFRIIKGTIEEKEIVVED